MKIAKQGDTVSVHYTGKLADGSVFDSSKGREPLEFTIGAGMLIPGFDRAVAGMAEGQSTTVEISPEDAYGPKHDELIVRVDRAELPEDFTPEIGLCITMSHPEEGEVDTVITGITDDIITLDANHPLAGETLIFEIELVSILGA